MPEPIDQQEEIMLTSQIKNAIKHILALNPWIYDKAWTLYDLRKPIYRIHNDESIHLSDRERETFDAIYNANLWSCSESKSGYGSTLAYTAQLRKDLRNLVEYYDIRSLLDAPCGDFNWMQQIEFPEDFRYIGGDIVGGLVDELSNKYKDARRTFVTMDVSRDALPDVDLWLCRDCLFHLPNSDILATLQNFQRSEIRFLLTTTFRFPRSNIDITHGAFRYINLSLAPFCLPKPLTYIKDYVVPFAPRWLGLWSRAQLADWEPKEG